MTVEAPDTIRRGEQIGLRLDIFNNWDQDMEVRLFSFGTTYLMPVTHIPEISTKNSYQKTGTINRHENETHPIRCQKNLVPNCISDASKTSSTSFWHWFLVSVPWALLCAIPFSRGRALPFVCLSVCLFQITVEPIHCTRAGNLGRHYYSWNSCFYFIDLYAIKGKSLKDVGWVLQMCCKNSLHCVSCEAVEWDLNDRLTTLSRMMHIEVILVVTLDGCILA